MPETLTWGFFKELQSRNIHWRSVRLSPNRLLLLQSRRDGRRTTAHPLAMFVSRHPLHVIPDLGRHVSRLFKFAAPVKRSAVRYSKSAYSSEFGYGRLAIQVSLTATAPLLLVTMSQSYGVYERDEDRVRKMVYTNSHCEFRGLRPRQERPRLRLEKSLEFSKDGGDDRAASHAGTSALVDVIEIHGRRQGSSFANRRRDQI
jgi:hypothetical protein